MSQPSLSADIVSVFVYRSRSRAECSCGWEGNPRRRKARAVFDALLHAADKGCRENWPLVYDERGPRRSLAPLAWLAAATAIIGGALYLSAPANADPVADYTLIAAPVICDALAERPYVSTVVDLVRVIMVDSGYDGGFAGSVIGSAVRDYCPQNQAPLDRFIAVYAPNATAHPINGAVGGRIA